MQEVCDPKCLELDRGEVDVRVVPAEKALANTLIMALILPHVTYPVTVVRYVISYF